MFEALPRRPALRQRGRRGVLDNAEGGGSSGLFAAGLRYVGRTVVEGVFPRRCAACRRFWIEGAPAASAATAPEPADKLALLFHREARRFLCPVCREAFEATSAPLCTCCGVMFQSRVVEDHRCGDCLKSPPSFRRARAAGVYSGALMALVHHLKYRACLAMIAPLALLLQEAFHRYWHPGEIDMVLPMPLHVGRLRRRGFNQAQLLADAWAVLEQGTVFRGLQFPKARRVLRRSRSTAPQTGLGKRERRRNLRGAFAVVDSGMVKGRRILLVDDVYTTGATADEAARTLKRRGAAAVDVLTVARTMPRFGRRYERPEEA